MSVSNRIQRYLNSATITLAPLWCAVSLLGQQGPDGASYITFSGLPVGINNSNTVAGRFSSLGGAGFLRFESGEIVSFNVGTGGDTRPVAINAADTVTGFFFQNSAYYGFIRARQGGIVTFAVRDGTTFPAAINVEGTVTGSFCPCLFPGPISGFVRYPGGQIVSFDPPGSIYTSPTGINASKTITGTFEDADGHFHGFVRDPFGNITSFDPPGGGQTSPVSINDAGEIAGPYVADGSFHGFIRSASGTFITIDGPGSIGTSIASINARGTITGTYQLSTVLTRSFVRTPNGEIETFSVPNCDSNPSAPAEINDLGVVLGTCSMGISGRLGYLRIPPPSH